MAKDKKSVLLYCDLIHTVEELSDDEAGRLFKHYLRYINDMDPVEPDKLTKIVFEPIKQTLKRDLKTWKAKVKKRSDAGKKGMITRWGNVTSPITNDNNVINPITKITDSVIVKDKVNVKDSDIVILWDQTKKDFFNDFRWIEQFCRNKGVRKDELERQMKQFIVDIDLSNDVKNLEELQSHFLHSFNKGKYVKVAGSVTEDKEAQRGIEIARRAKMLGT